MKDPKELILAASMFIAAIQIRTFIELNCVEVPNSSPQQYLFDSENTDLDDPELSEQHRATVLMYKGWIIALSTVMAREVALVSFGFWPALSEDRSAVGFETASTTITANSTPHSPLSQS